MYDGASLRTFQEEGEGQAAGWIHPSTESMRFWVGGGHVQILANKSLSLVHDILDETLLNTLYPQLGLDDLLDLQAGGIVQVVEWVPPSEEEQNMLDALAEQMKGEGG